MRKERKVLFTFRIPRLRWSGRKLRYDKSAQRVLSTPSPPCGGCPHVAMGIATVIGHRMTSSHSSKDPLRPPVSGGETDPSPALPCMGGSNYNRLVPHQQNIILSLPYREGWGGSILQNLYIPLCTLLCGEILVSSRLGPRMESAMNMNEQAHDNMSALPRQNDDDDGCPQCTASAPILLL